MAGHLNVCCYKHEYTCLHHVFLPGSAETITKHRRKTGYLICCNVALFRQIKRVTENDTNCQVWNATVNHFVHHVPCYSIPWLYKGLIIDRWRPPLVHVEHRRLLEGIAQPHFQCGSKSHRAAPYYLDFYFFGGQFTEARLSDTIWFRHNTNAISLGSNNKQVIRKLKKYLLLCTSLHISKVLK